MCCETNHKCSVCADGGSPHPQFTYTAQHTHALHCAQRSFNRIAGAKRGVFKQQLSCRNDEISPNHCYVLRVRLYKKLSLSQQKRSETYRIRYFSSDWLCSQMDHFNVHERHLRKSKRGGSISKLWNKLKGSTAHHYTHARMFICQRGSKILTPPKKILPVICFQIRTYFNKEQTEI